MLEPISLLDFSAENFEIGDTVEAVTKDQRRNAKLDRLVTQMNVVIAHLNTTTGTGGGEGTGTPAAPTNAVATVLSEASVRLQWTRPDETNIAEYELFRRELPNGNRQLIATIAPANSYVFAGLSESTQYLFEVEGQNVDSENGSAAGAVATTSSGASASGRASDAYAQTLGSPIINRLERDSSGTVRFYYGPPIGTTYGGNVSFEFSIGGQVYTSDSSGYHAIPNAPGGSVGVIRAINAVNETRSADVSRSINNV